MEMKEIGLWNDKYKSWIPADFSDMEEKDIRLRYPMNMRPEVIKQSKDQLCEFNFSKNVVGTYENIVEQLRDKVKKYFNMTHLIKEINEDFVIEDEYSNLAKGFCCMKEIMEQKWFCAFCYKQIGQEIINISITCRMEQKEEYFKTFKQCVSWTQSNTGRR